MFHFTCQCGAYIRTPSKEGKCWNCGTEFTLVWPFGEIGSKVKTISEQYDDRKEPKK